MSKTKEQPKPIPPSLPPGLPKARPRSLLCMLCGFRTLDREAFKDHCREVHP